MKLLVLLCLIALAAVECEHRFLGTNILRPMVHHHNVKYSSNIFSKRIESYNYTLPKKARSNGHTIQGILAYDLTNTGASTNITRGGIGYNFVELRMKSDRGREINYDIYIYA